MSPSASLPGGPAATGRDRGQPRAGRGRVRLRTLIVIRWVAIAGQLAALLIVRFGLGYALPLAPTLGVVAASALLNLWALRPWSGRRRTAQLGDRDAALYLGFDLIQVAALLYLTGGLHNPFAVLILAPVTVSATTLSRSSTVGLALLALVIVAGLAVRHLPLPWREPGFTQEPMFVLGFAIALGVAVVFTAVYVISVAEEAQRMSDALSATQMALAREQRRSALGALAAAAAHGLGTPLATIAVVAKEIARDLPADSPLREDVELLLSQSDRCREILAGLATRPEAGDHEAALMPAEALIESVAAPYRTGRAQLVVQVEEAAGPGRPGAAESVPLLPSRPEIVHGLGNLIENAFEFAHTTVRVAIAQGRDGLSVRIADDGPGFDPGLVGRLGEPYLFAGSQGRRVEREGKDVHMGLGVFIAQRLLEQTGASLAFANRPEGGAEVTVVWSAAALARLLAPREENGE
ncbi:MAG: ActS/PrrB/RegB family redox-sensitive histidine kinase [Rhodospirillaceae bacterium]|nr:ActS/PrrB/RegB family redox-sensitive histidine kinase [Rhodospirillaceae bacterium]